MIFNKVFENVFTVESGIVTDVDWNLLEDLTSWDYVEWISDFVNYDSRSIKGVFATHEHLVLIITDSQNDRFDICRLVLTGSYQGQTDVSIILKPEYEMMNHILGISS